MPHGHPRTGNEEYIRVKLRKCTHLLWTERKRALHLKSDNELARYLLNLPCARDDTQQFEEMPVAHFIPLVRFVEALPFSVQGNSCVAQ